MKSRIAIPQLAKVRAILQKEIGSVCPFCQNDDVGHFEIHHIDENPTNNEIGNLLLLCPTCHSKITKGDITSIDVYKKKLLLLTTPISNKSILMYLQPIITQYFIDNKSEIWLLFLIAHSKR